MSEGEAKTNSAEPNSESERMGSSRTLRKIRTQPSVASPEPTPLLRKVGKQTLITWRKSDFHSATWNNPTTQYPSRTLLHCFQIMIVLGPPGCGKNTHSPAIASALNLPYISTGNVIRSTAIRKSKGQCSSSTSVLAHSY